MARKNRGSKKRKVDDGGSGPSLASAEPNSHTKSTSTSSFQATPVSTPSGFSGKAPKRPRNRPTRDYSWLYTHTDALASTVSQDSIDQLPDTSKISSAGGVGVLCSYNWSDAKRPTILVPGGAPKWTPRECPVGVPQDNGSYYVDQNADQNPEMPFEPMFAAISVMSPDVDLTEVDIIINRNTLRNLFKFVQGEMWDSFRIQMDMVGKTLFITRREQYTSYNTHNRPASWGHAFEHAFTKFEPALSRSSSHHRAARYKFGELQLLVRHEVDADYEDVSSPAVAQGLGSNTSGDNGSSDLQNITDSNANEELNSDEAADRGVDKGVGKHETKVVRAGTGTLPSHLSEMKSKQKKMRVEDAMDQLWFGRTPRLILGKHQHGTFSDPQIHDCESRFAGWEDKHQASLQKVAKVLTSLRQQVMKMEGKCAIGVYDVRKWQNIHIWTCIEAEPPIPARYIQKHWPNSNATSNKSETCQHEETQEPENGPEGKGEKGDMDASWEKTKVSPVDKPSDGGERPQKPEESAKPSETEKDDSAKPNEVEKDEVEKDEVEKPDEEDTKKN
ncbi:geranylgeranyl pyrophosphate synthetase [Colletotrichum musicola]|uniref:Geranylgeranyl pyrophosphate synthetase n=1 Tax=Colletotrichum musicola TaxID=2175873 RepID=A0A8H6JSI4_9PEZI|nr:geranylgeranyl pyrophosphate synthetase [Colletotrichum musicola]